MRLSDIAVEVRDKTFTRIGSITADYFNIQVVDRFNGIGDWKLSLPSEHPMCSTLATPGSGIIIYAYNNAIFSGPTSQPEYNASQSDREGTVNFTGVSDSVVLGEYLAFPQPSNADPATQTVDVDSRTGVCETLMHAYVNANMGPSAPVARRKSGFTLGTNLARGPSVTMKPRYQVLGELMGQLATAGNLGYRVIQSGSGVQFQTYLVTDRTATVRLDVLNGTLSSAKATYTVPGLTQAIAAGSGTGAGRIAAVYSTAASLAAETAWGRRIERFIDAGTTATTTADLQTKATELLTKQGFTQISAEMSPIDQSVGSFMAYGHDWAVGDRVAVSIADQELAATVTGFAVKLDTAGLQMAAVIGDRGAFDSDDRLIQEVISTTSRVSAVERAR